MKNQIYITTAIPYVNGDPHLGFTLELVQADVIARYYRLINTQTLFQTGTDENAFKNVLSARRAGIETSKFVRHNADKFLRLNDRLKISLDSFIRTSCSSHQSGAQLLWQQCRQEDIYQKSYTGLYCTGCEDFLNEGVLIDGLCPEHRQPPTETSETNYFFRLSAYQDKLEKLISDDTIRVVPLARKNQVLSFIRSGLQDFSISRNSDRSGGWGVPVPGDPSQTIYVWIDALANYLTGIGFGTNNSWLQTWNEHSKKIHVIGKNVWKFHAIYWPAILLSAGLPLPNEIVVHGFLTENGSKISKSLGNATDPNILIDQYGPDPLRYYLLAEFSPFNDGDFSLDRFRKTYETRLANTLGNLLSRLTTICQKSSFSKFDPAGIPQAPDGFHDFIAQYQLDKALALLWSVITTLNQDIDNVKPWILIKENKLETVREILPRWLARLEQAAYWLTPFMPDTAGTILKTIRSNPITPGEILFPK